MTITATEFKTNLGKYLDLVCEVDIVITKNGRAIAQLTRPTEIERKKEALRKLIGIAQTDKEIDLDEIKTERIMRK